MKIGLLEPYFGGSHQRWAEGLQRHSRHQIEILSMPARHWKWRMHGAAVTLANTFQESNDWDLILATDMLDLSTFLSLLDRKKYKIPALFYFHENQLTYPWSPTDPDVKTKRDNHYAWINYTSALAADQVLFNSSYHKNSFLNALPSFLNQFPDFNGSASIDKIKMKCEVMHLGMDLPTFSNSHSSSRENVILWNHRWEYDKNPETFFKSLFRLKAEGIAFKLIVCGESYKQSPSIFKQAKVELSDRIIHFGFTENRAHYQNLLHQASLLPVTAIQDFFGGAVVEAIAAGLYPILPDRLAYKEHIPKALHQNHFYQTDEDFYQMIRTQLITTEEYLHSKTLVDFVNRYSWENSIVKYDYCFEKLCADNFADTKNK